MINLIETKKTERKERILREEERSVELPTPCLEMTGTEAKLEMSSRNSQIGAECVILTKFCIISSLPDRLIKRPTTLGNVGTRGGLRKDMMR